MIAMNLPETESPAPPRHVWGGWATVGFGAVVMAVSFFIQVLVMVAFALVIAFSLINPSAGLPDMHGLFVAILAELRAYEGTLTAFTIIASALVCGGLIVIIIKVRGRATVAEYLGLRRINFKTALVMLVVAAGFLGLSAVMAWLFNITNEPDYIVDVYNTSVWPVLLWLSLVVFAPLFEEVFFRGFLFEGFRQSRIGLTGAVLLTALLWAVSHLQYNYYGMATIFVLGVILGIVRHKTGSLVAPLLIHAFNNAAALLMLLFQLG